MKLKKKHYIIGGCLAVMIVSAAVIALNLYGKVTAPFLHGSFDMVDGKIAYRQPTRQIVFIDNDDTADSVFTKLLPLATTKAKDGFRLLASHYDYADHVRTGRYAIEPDATALDVFRRLRNGQQEPVMLTIPEVRTMDRMAGRLGAKLMLDSATIASALLDKAFCQRWGYDTTTIACLFVPDSYEVWWNTTLDEFMKRMQKEHERFWNDERRQKAAAQQLTPEEVVTLASIIDEETANDAEKPVIAGMYLNRLRRGMLLQADPTVKYALRDFTLRRILNKHLETDSPYNTYKYAGLPPGPIRVPSVKAIDAVLNADVNDYLFMCAKEDFSGTHNFARTLAEHQQNARRYQQALNRLGIR